MNRRLQCIVQNAVTRRFQIMSDTVRAVVSGCMAWLSCLRTMGSSLQMKRRPRSPALLWSKGELYWEHVDVYQLPVDFCLYLPARKWAALGAFFFSWVALMTLIGVSGYVKRLFTKIFSEEEPSAPKKIASPRGAALPAAYSAPVVNSGQQFVDTSKMAQPSSITEQTTSRFNKV